jgi:hypothetical protein
MAKNQPGVRITFDELEEMPLEEGMQRFGFDNPYDFMDYKNNVRASEQDAMNERVRHFPAILKSPKAGVEYVMSNFGKTGVVKDPVVHQSMFGSGEFDDEFAGYTRSPNYDAIPRGEYESMLSVFEKAYNGNPKAAETVNSLIRESIDFKKRNSRR